MIGSRTPRPICPKHDFLRRDGSKIATLLETDNVQRRRTGRITQFTATGVVDLESRLTFLFRDRIWKDKYNPKTEDAT